MKTGVILFVLSGAFAFWGWFAYSEDALWAARPIWAMAGVSLLLSVGGIGISVFRGKRKHSSSTTGLGGGFMLRP